jgi:hypothetical protein
MGEKQPGQGHPSYRWVGDDLEGGKGRGGKWALKMPEGLTRELCLERRQQQHCIGRVSRYGGSIPGGGGKGWELEAAGGSLPERRRASPCDAVCATLLSPPLAAWRCAALVTCCSSRRSCFPVCPPIGRTPLPQADAREAGRVAMNPTASRSGMPPGRAGVEEATWWPSAAATAARRVCSFRSVVVSESRLASTWM